MATVYEVLNQAPGLVFQFGGAEVTSFKALTSTTTLTQDDGRVIECDPTGGAFSVLLPASPSLGYTIAIRNVSASTNVITINGNGKNINGSATQSIAAAYGCRLIQYMPAAGAQPAQYIMIEGNTAGGGAPAAHASTHRAGGSDDLLGAPGPIGGTTQDIVSTTDIRMNLGVGTANASRLSLFPSADFTSLAMRSPGGSKAVYGQVETTTTAVAWKRMMVVSLADDATADITISSGGFGTACAPATAASGGSFSFLADGTASTNGVTYTNFAAADTDTKLCVFASAGKLRVRNRLGSTQVVLVEITEALNA